MCNTSCLNIDRLKKFFDKKNTDTKKLSAVLKNLARGY